MIYLMFRAVPFRLGLLALCLIALASCASPADRALSAGGTETPALQTSKVLPPAGSAYERFGHAVATDGETVVVGAWGHDGEAGAAYVYELTPEGWAQTALLVPDDATAGARFGYSLDVEAGRVAVGAVYDPEAGRDAGAVYVFERDGSGWKQTAKVAPEGEADYSHFGRSVSIAGDRLAVGAPGVGASAVHTFILAGAGWQREEVLESPSPATDITFGTAVALSQNTLAVGAWTEREDATGFVVLFERTLDGWAEDRRLTSDETGDRFGYSVSLEGGLLAVGAPDALQGSMLHLYERTAGTWTELAPVIPEGHSAELGHAVALRDRTLLAGDPAFDGRVGHGGQLILAESDSGTPGSLYPSDLAEGSSFGISVAAGGDVIVVGAVGDKTSGHAAGAAYIYY